MGIIGSAFLGYTRVFGAGDNRFQPPVIDGLLALYNPAYEGGYNGTNVIYDLSGNSKDLTLAGSYSQDSDDSIAFTTTATAETSTDISTDLHGTSAEMTIVFLTRKNDDSGPPYSSYGGRWLLGPSSGFSGNNVLFEWEVKNFGIGKIGYGTLPVFDAGGGYYYQVINNPNSSTGTIANYYRNNVSDTEATFLAYTKADQTASYPGTSTNMKVYMKNFQEGTNVVRVNTLTSTVGYGSFNDFSSGDNYLNRSSDPSGTDANILTTNLASSKFFLNDVASKLGMTTNHGPKNFNFMGAGIWNKVLSQTEIEEVISWYSTSYPTANL